MHYDTFIKKLEDMSERKTRYVYSTGDYWNALGDAAETIAELQEALVKAAMGIDEAIALLNNINTDYRHRVLAARPLLHNLAADANAVLLGRRDNGG